MKMISYNLTNLGLVATVTWFTKFSFILRRIKVDFHASGVEFGRVELISSRNYPLRSYVICYSVTRFVRQAISRISLSENNYVGNSAHNIILGVSLFELRYLSASN